MRNNGLTTGREVRVKRGDERDPRPIPSVLQDTFHNSADFSCERITAAEALNRESAELS